jgi:DNA-3-methyladenine glycosylase
MEKGSSRGRVIKGSEMQSADTVGMAKWLLGKALVRTKGGKREVGIITEVEAYHTELDLASHASRGKTPRTQVLYSLGGVWYVYLIYGMYHMLNLVTGPEGTPAAVLIRGLDSVTGPGRLTKALGIDMRFNGRPVAPRTGLHLEDLGIIVPSRRISATPRIGVDYAGPVWSKKPWRFVAKAPVR